MVEISVYDTSLTRLGAVNTCVSLVWTVCYRDEGECVLEFQMADGLMDLFRPDRYMGLRGTDGLMIIKSVQATKDGTILVNGSGIAHLLAERISTQIVKSGNAEVIMRQLVRDYCTDWPCLELGLVSGLPDVYQQQTSDGTVMEYLLKISEATDVGFRIRKEGKRLLFECYKPGLNAFARYSAKRGNLSGLEYTDSTIRYKNVAVVAGAGEGADRVTVVVGETSATGADRREMYVDARGVQPEEGESADDYRLRLEAYGAEKLDLQGKIHNVEFVPTSIDAELGDIVTVLVPEYGSTMKARITSITTEMQDNVVTRSMTIGEPILSGRSAGASGIATVNAISTGGGGAPDPGEYAPAWVQHGTLNSSNPLTIDLAAGYYLLSITHTSATAAYTGLWSIYKSASGGAAVHLSPETTPYSFAFGASGLTITSTASATVRVRSQLIS